MSRIARKVLPQYSDAPPVEFYALAELLRAAVTDTPVTALPEPLDGEFLLALAQAHGITALAFEKLPPSSVSPELFSRWKAQVKAAFARQWHYDTERNAILEELSQSGVDWLPLKGLVLRDWYPVGIRESGDNDLLIRSSDTETVRACFDARGYTVESTGEHDGFFREPFLFEMHTRLCAENSLFAPLLEDIWERAIPDEVSPHTYRMSTEDLWIYTVAHAYHHDQIGGTGLRLLSDFWITNRVCAASPEFDRAAAEQKLDSVGALEYYRYLAETSTALFEGDFHTVPPQAAAFICRSGAHGSRDNNLLRDWQQHGILYRLFLPYSMLKEHYPVLKYCPFLLPLFWCVRWVGLIKKALDRRNVLKNDERMGKT